MNDKSKFTQETLDKIRSGEKPKAFVKKRKMSRIVLLVDIIIIIFIVMIINRKGPESFYHTTSLILNKIDYRFSLIREKESGKYISSLTIKSNSEREKQLFYNKSIADLAFKHNKTIINNSTIGDNIISIKLLPGELKTFVKEIETSYFIKYTEEHPEYIKPLGKTLFTFENRHIPLEVIITLNTKDKISTSLYFKHEVE